MVTHFCIYLVPFCIFDIVLIVLKLRWESIHILCLAQPCQSVIHNLSIALHYILVYMNYYCSFGICLDFFFFFLNWNPDELVEEQLSVTHYKCFSSVFVWASGKPENHC